MRDALARALTVDGHPPLPLIVRGLHTIFSSNLGDLFDSLLHLAGYVRFERTIVPLVGHPDDHQTS
jgi:hypothetical protein